MTEFTAQDALRPRWNPEHASRAMSGCLIGCIILVGVGIVGAVAIGFLGLLRDPVVVGLAVFAPLGTAVMLAAVAGVIYAHQEVGRFLFRFAFIIFLAAVVSLILFPWSFALMLGYVDAIAAAQTGEALQTTTTFGGELTIRDIQAHLLTEAEREAGMTAGEGTWSTLAYLLWPFQFSVLRDLIGAFAALGFVSMTASFAIWWERKVAGRIQSRLGPMRVGGWHGWAQSIADGLKLVQKEDIVPAQADGPLFRLAPYMVFIPVLAAVAALPFGETWIFRDLDVALLFILAMVGIDIVGVIIGGWASNNKWSVYGAMREASQVISYEIPMGMSLLIPVMTAGTLKLSEIGAMQSGGFSSWLAFANPFTFVASVTYFIAALASCKRAPFDLPEAESELVAGFHTEYSGFRWAVFFFGEYAAMFVVAGLATILFFGAWHSPLPASWGAGLADGPFWQQTLHAILFSGPLWFIAKAYAILYIQIWLRWTLPRIRIDHVMYACIQVLLPLAMVLLLGNTFWHLLVPAESLVQLVANFLMAAIGAFLVLGFIAIAAYGYINRLRLAGTMALKHLPGS